MSMLSYGLFSLFIKVFLFLTYVSYSNTSISTDSKYRLDERVESTLHKIYENLQKTQCKKEKRFRIFPPRMGENKGLYRSYIHVNIMDTKNSLPAKIIRQFSQITDMNNFVTNFVVMALLESYEHRGIKELDMESLNDSLNALLDFHEHTYDANVPIYTFWRQINVNGTWTQYPENMCAIVKFVPTISDKLIEDMEKLGLHKIAGALTLINSLSYSFKSAYHIPADNDDTSINMALTGIIHKIRGKLDPRIADKWIESNKDYESLFKYLKYFAYRPFMKERDDARYSNFTNLIDSRSYYVLHDFLKENQSEDIILPTTWIFDINQENLYFPLQWMPFSINNVDFNVAANFLYGVTNIVLFNPNKDYIHRPFDGDLRKMYMSVVGLISYAIKKKIVETRPDLAFLYYPSVFDFYWLASRTFSTLKNFNLETIEDEDIKIVLINARDKLEDVLKNEATKQILEKINKDKDGNFYFMEFLGNYANKTRGEDAIFATGLGLNSLINIWTRNIYTNSTSKEIEKIVFDEIEQDKMNCDFPIEEIIETVDKLVNHIIKSFDEHFPTLEGAFFSGSVKSFETLEYWYPSNYNVFLNGTHVEDITNPNNIEMTLASGVTGYVKDEEYQEMLDQVYYGFKVPKEFKGFNPNSFPYWSSPAVTYSVNLLGLSKYRLLKK